MAKGRMQKRVDSWKAKQGAHEVVSRKPVGDWNNHYKYGWGPYRDSPTDSEIQFFSKKFR